jgi:hypothetical protein
MKDLKADEKSDRQTKVNFPRSDVKRHGRVFLTKASGLTLFEVSSIASVCESLLVSARVRRRKTKACFCSKVVHDLAPIRILWQSTQSRLLKGSSA